MVKAPWRQRWRWLFVPLILLALGTVGKLLWESLPVLWANLPKLKAGWLALVVAGNLASTYLAFEAFRCLFGQVCPGAYGRVTLARFYFIGQLLKHLPGRFWGVAYQSASGGRASLAEWVSATVVYMLLTIAFALWAALVVIGFILGLHWGVLAIAVGGAIYALLWNAYLISWLLALLRRAPLSAMVRLCDAVQSFAMVDGYFKTRVLGWFAASWILYLLAWAGYGLAWPSLTAFDGVKLCALYTVAWFAGYVSLVSPSGIGIRELVFVLLARDFPPDAVAGMAVMGRAVLLVVDVLLASVFAPLKGKKHENS